MHDVWLKRILQLPLVMIVSSSVSGRCHHDLSSGEASTPQYDDTKNSVNRFLKTS